MVEGKGVLSLYFAKARSPAFVPLEDSYFLNFLSFRLEPPLTVGNILGKNEERLISI